jgi:hypothetical protein
MTTTAYAYTLTVTDPAVPNRFPILDSGVTGVDPTGALAPTAMPLAPGMYILLVSAATAADVAAACLAFARARGLAHEGPGANPNTNRIEDLAQTLTAIAEAAS